MVEHRPTTEMPSEKVSAIKLHLSVTTAAPLWRLVWPVIHGNKKDTPQTELRRLNNVQYYAKTFCFLSI